MDVPEAIKQTLGSYAEYVSTRKMTGEWGALPIERVNAFEEHYWGAFFPHGVMLGNNSSLPQPQWSVCIPAALRGEPIENVIFTTGEIYETCQNGAGPAEVTIWSNSRFPDEAEECSRIMSAYDDFICKLKGVFPPDLRVRAVHNLLEPHHNFNEIRAHATGAIARDAVRRQFPADHPIVWLDADTTFIAPNAIADVIASLKDKRAYFVRTNLVLTGDNPHAPPLPERSDAEKVAAIYGIARRMIEQNLEFTDPRGYVDESGLAFTLGTYLRSGGVSTLDPKLGESRTLLTRAAEAQRKGRLDPSIPLLGYVKEARIGNSHRRFVALARCLKAWQLPGSVEGDDYVDFQSMDRNAMQPRRDKVTVDEVNTMIDVMTVMQESRTATSLTTAQRRRLTAIIARCAFDL